MDQLFNHAPRPVTLIIPARFGSSRFPGKPLVVLRGAGGVGKPLIQRVWETARRVSRVDRILIATDDQAIASIAHEFGAEVIMTSAECRNGTERCAEAIGSAGIRDGLIVNLQGDAPLTPPEAIEALIVAMHDDPSIAVATPMLHCPAGLVGQLVADERAGSPSATTVIADRHGDALYFSRRVLPWFGEDAGEAPVFMHCGVYAYRIDALARYAAAEPSAAEQVETLEQLRFLDIGLAIRMLTMAEPPGGLWEVNRPSDIASVEAGLRTRSLA